MRGRRRWRRSQRGREAAPLWAGTGPSALPMVGPHSLVSPSAQGDALARYGFVAGRGYERASVHEFRSAALAMIDSLLADRVSGGPSARMSDDEQAVVAAFRLLDDDRRADLLGSMFVLCAPDSPVMVGAQASGTSFDMSSAPSIGVATRTALGRARNAASRSALEPAEAAGERGLPAPRSERQASSGWPPPGSLGGHAIRPIALG